MERYALFTSGTSGIRCFGPLGVVKQGSGTRGMERYAVFASGIAVFWALGVVKQGSGTSGMERYALFTSGIAV
jgi:hypothetical protein